MTSADALIAREWALRAVESAENAQPVSRGALAAARHILATTTPPTMADIAWVDDVHSGRYAEHPKYGVVLMLVENAFGDIEVLCVEEGRLCSRWAHPANLTPIPGTKIILTPRREPVSNEGAETGNENRNEGVMTGNDHPVALSSVDDYDSAPEGTIAADDDGAAVKAEDGTWRWTGSEYAYSSDDLCYGEADPMIVVRWGK